MHARFATLSVGGANPSADPSDLGWQVVDNGEGAAVLADQVGLQLEAATFGLPTGFAVEFCNATPNALDFGPRFGVVPLSVLLTDIEAGNVQIRVED